jgi:mono/diheme cytochrome c family protein
MVESEHSAVRAAAGWPDPQDTEKRTDGSQSVWDGVFTDEQAKRGEPLYGKYCTSCHGSTLEGAEMAPPLAGSAFSANWDGLTLGDLFERMRVSMPQDNPGSLSRQQYVDVLTYILSYNKFPAGKTELARETEVLKQIRFLALKP